MYHSSLRAAVRRYEQAHEPVKEQSKVPPQAPTFYAWDETVVEFKVRSFHNLTMAAAVFGALVRIKC
jgi:hypothetical protein